MDQQQLLISVIALALGYAVRHFNLLHAFLPASLGGGVTPQPLPSPAPRAPAAPTGSPQLHPLLADILPLLNTMAQQKAQTASQGFLQEVVTLLPTLFAGGLSGPLKASPEGPAPSPLAK